MLKMPHGKIQLIEFFKINGAILFMMCVSIIGVLSAIIYDRKIKDKTV